ncbi:MAG: hypothetical protein Q4C12_01470 [Clostridia bacterium]|nr:hypothetical protein [Clostridia bacterium]
MRYAKHVLKIFAVKVFFAFICVALSFLFAWLVKFAWGKVLYGVFLVICYASVMLSEGYSVAASDDKSYDKSDINVAHGIAVGAAVAFLHALLALFLYRLNSLTLLRLFGMPYTLLLPGAQANVPQLFFGINIPVFSPVFSSDYFIPFFGIFDMLLCIFGYILGKHKINFKQRLFSIFKYGTKK